MGLTSTPATFQRLMQTTMPNCLISVLLVYLDDHLVYSKIKDIQLREAPYLQDDDSEEETPGWYATLPNHHHRTLVTMPVVPEVTVSVVSDDSTRNESLSCPNRADRSDLPRDRQQTRTKCRMKQFVRRYAMAI